MRDSRNHSPSGGRSTNSRNTAENFIRTMFSKVLMLKHSNTPTCFFTNMSEHAVVDNKCVGVRRSELRVAAFARARAQHVSTYTQRIQH